MVTTLRQARESRMAWEKVEEEEENKEVLEVWQTGIKFRAFLSIKLRVILLN